MKMHKCKKIPDEDVSIRYDFKYDDENIRFFAKDKVTWRLFKYDKFEDHLIHVAEIKYCPFCNKRLIKDINIFKMLKIVFSKHFKKDKKDKNEEIIENSLNENKNSRITDKECEEWFNKVMNE